MKKAPRLLSLFLVQVLMLGCMTACGDDAPDTGADTPSTTVTTAPSGSGDSSDTTTTDGGSNTEDTTATTETTAGLTVNIKPTASKVTATRVTHTTKPNSSTQIPTSLDGQTIVISTWSTSTIPSKDGTDVGNAAYYAFEWAKKAYNVNVEWKVVPEETYFAEFITAALSGENYSDICLTHSRTYLSWINDGLIVPLNDYMKDKDSKYWNKTTFTLNGNLYAMRRENTSGVEVPENYFLYNPKLIKQLGLEDPQKLALEGKWTWDKFREYCQAATDPTSGTYGVTAFNLNQLMYTNSIEEIVYENGKYVNGYTHGKTATNMLELLTFLQEMAVEDGSILGSELGGVTAMNDAFNAFMDGKALFTFAQSTAWLKKQKYKDYAPVTFPIGPSNEGQYYNNVLEGFSCWSIPTNARYDYQDLVDFFCDANCTWDKSRGDAYYVGDIEDEIDAYYIKNWAKRSDAEFMYEIGKHVDTRIGWNVYVNNGGIEVFQIYQPVLMNASTPKSVLDATDGEIQTKINAVFN